MKVKLECHEANHICDKNQYLEASFWQKVKLTFHLAYCRACRTYTASNTKLTKTMQNPKIQTVSQDEKNALKEKLARELGQ